MKKRDKSEAATLRNKAEEQLKKKQSRVSSLSSENDIRKLYHELQVHQIELEIQNEELRLAKELADIATIKYTELYDFAPSGYFTLNKQGEITELNLYGANMLCTERHNLKKCAFTFFVSNDTKSVFNLFLDKVFKSKVKVSCEVTLLTNGNLPKYVHLTGIISEDSNLCYLTIVDITEKTLAEEEVRNMKKALEMLNHRFIKVSENERILISSEIHDQLGQSLVALNLDVHWLSKKIDCDSEEGKKISGIIELLTSLIKDVQKISFEVRPLMLNDLGLCSTMECFCDDFEKRTMISCHLMIDEVNYLNENKSLTLFRILQEALTNVMRHSNAKNVNVNLSSCEDTIILEVIDDGIGFEENKINSYKSLGFIGIRERIRQFDGKLDIISTLNKGTTVRITMPSS